MPIYLFVCLSLQLESHLPGRGDGSVSRGLRKQRDPRGRWWREGGTSARRDSVSKCRVENQPRQGGAGPGGAAREPAGGQEASLRQAVHPFPPLSPASDLMLRCQPLLQGREKQEFFVRCGLAKWGTTMLPSARCPCGRGGHSVPSEGHRAGPPESARLSFFCQTAIP